MMYYIDKKNEYLGGDVILHHKQYYNHIDYIPINLLTEVKECDKAECGYLEISEDGLKRRINSLINKKTKYLTKREIGAALSDVFECITSLTTYILYEKKAEGRLSQKYINIGSNWFFNKPHSHVLYENLAASMGFYIINIERTFYSKLEERIYVDLKSYKKGLDEYNEERNNTIDSWYSKEIMDYVFNFTKKLVAYSFKKKFGEHFNFDNISRKTSAAEAFLSAKKLSRLSYKNLHEVITNINGYKLSNYGNISVYNIEDAVNYLYGNKKHLTVENIKLLKEYKKVFKCIT